MSKRMRADRLLVERGLFESRAKAQEAIAAGHGDGRWRARSQSRPTTVSADAVLRGARRRIPGCRAAA